MKKILPFALSLVFFQIPFALAENENAENTIGYLSIEDAFDALEKDPSATLTEHEGWTVFNKKQNGVYELWSFTPPFHSAHPAVVKREIASQDGEVNIRMNALCYAEKEHCDALVDSFKEINENLKQNLAQN